MKSCVKTSRNSCVASPGVLAFREKHCFVGAFQSGRRDGEGTFVESRPCGVAVHAGEVCLQRLHDLCGCAFVCLFV